MSKTLLVLAASRYQVEAIKAAKRLGLRVVSCDNKPDNPGHLLADRCYQVDTTDMAGILEVAKAEKIDGIIAPCTDVALPTAAYVAEKYNLIAPSYQAAVILTDKWLFRNFMRDIGMPYPNYTSSEDTVDTCQFQNQYHNCIVKPNKSSGSKGIAIIKTSDELKSRIIEARNQSLDSVVIVEEIIIGSQHTCEGILQGGKVKFFLITDRFTQRPPYTTTVGHRVPTTLGMQRQKELTTAIEKVFTSLEIQESVFDCDFVSGEEQVVILELTPRLGGNSLAKLIRHGCGFDITEFAVKQACGVREEISQVENVSPCAVIILGTEKTGLLEYRQQYASCLRSKDYVKDFAMDYQRGDKVEAFINGRNRIGEVVITAENRDDLDDRVAEINTGLGISVR